MKIVEIQIKKANKKQLDNFINHMKNKYGYKSYDIERLKQKGIYVWKYLGREFTCTGHQNISGIIKTIKDLENEL
jgi:hypothetical protein